MKNHTYLLLILFGVLILLAGATVILFRNNTVVTPEPAPIIDDSSETFSYRGEDGVDAMTLLKNSAEVTEQSGFVVSINGRAAQDNMREFWAFSVNGEPSSVGASEYITTGADEIMWKIERY